MPNSPHGYNQHVAIVINCYLIVVRLVFRNYKSESWIFRVFISRTQSWQRNGIIKYSDGENCVIYTLHKIVYKKLPSHSGILAALTVWYFLHICIKMLKNEQMEKIDHWISSRFKENYSICKRPSKIRRNWIWKPWVNCSRELSWLMLVWGAGFGMVEPPGIWERTSKLNQYEASLIAYKHCY